MKKTTLLLGAAAMIAFASCKKEVKDDASMQDTTAVPQEMPVEPAPADTTAASPVKDTVAVVKTGKSDETTVSVGKEGVSVKSDNGAKSTTVKVAKDNSKVEVKK